MNHSLYDDIGVAKTATQDEIESASTRLAQEFIELSKKGNLHAAARFKAVEYAYEILGNPDTRRQYDNEAAALLGPTPNTDQSNRNLNVTLLSFTTRKLSVFAIVVVVLVGVGVFSVREKLPFGNRIATDEKAKNAVVALRKLAARTEAGISYRDYSPVLGEALFSVKTFLSSDSAKINPEFTQAVLGSMKWFAATGEVWQAQFKHDRLSGSCTDRMLYEIPPLCESYPELKTEITEWTVGGEKKASGINFKTAIPKSWELAGAELRKAEQLMK